LSFVYVAFPVHDLASAIAGIRALNIHGVSVTIPHKVEAIGYLDEVEETASFIGSINTIVNEKGSLKGYNSDGLGALTALEEAGVDVNGKDVLILGSGGAARAIGFTLATKKKIKNLHIAGIVEEELKALVEDIAAKTGAPVSGSILAEDRLGDMIAKSPVLIHCTPIGMHPKVGETVVPKRYLRQDVTVFDVVYIPLRTRLLKEAEDVGCRTVPGIDMFLWQAVFQFELWTGVRAPVPVMRRVLEEHFAR
jgi:shikimate dehydrogenase